MYTGAAKYGQISVADTFQGPPLAINSGSVTSRTHPKFWDPDSPELWLVGIAAVTLGLIAVSTSVKVGPLRLSGSI